MTRKDYEMVAKAINKSVDNNDLMQPIMVDTLLRNLYPIFEADNPRFDRARFNTAATQTRKAQ
jgi:hypothetical protein